MCTRKSARQVEVLLAARFPRPDVRDLIRRLPVSARSTLDVGSGAQVGVSAEGATARSSDRTESDPRAQEALPTKPTELSAPMEAPRANRVEPLSADRYGVHFTADGEFRDLLERVRGLAGHRLPSGDLLTLLKRGLEAYERELEKKRFAVGRKPRATGRMGSAKADSERSRESASDPGLGVIAPPTAAESQASSSRRPPPFKRTRHHSPAAAREGVRSRRQTVQLRLGRRAPLHVAALLGAGPYSALGVGRRQHSRQSASAMPGSQSTLCEAMLRRAPHSRGFGAWAAAIAVPIRVTAPRSKLCAALPGTEPANPQVASSTGARDSGAGAERVLAERLPVAAVAGAELTVSWPCRIKRCAMPKEPAAAPALTVNGWPSQPAAWVVWTLVSSLVEPNRPYMRSSGVAEGALIQVAFGKPSSTGPEVAMQRPMRTYLATIGITASFPASKRAVIQFAISCVMARRCARCSTDLH